MKKRGEVIAVDLGGTNLRTALVKDNTVKRFIKKKTPNTKNKILKELSVSISKLISKNVKGIGIASPGPLYKGKILETPNLPFKNFDLRSFVQKKFKVPVIVENDANCVALAEARLGVKKKNFFVLTLGTGIGGGVIIDGKLYNRQNVGAELGEIFISEKNTLEDLSASKAVARLTKKHLNNPISFGELIKIKSRKSERVMEEIAKSLGRGIGTLINIFNPEIVVLSGGMSKAGVKFLEMIRNETKKYILLPGKYKIIWSRLNHPGILGASLLFS